MCFSASASFGLGAALLPVGAYCVQRAARKDPDYLALGMIPLGFSLQQLSEGFVWLGLNDGRAEPGSPAVLTFLFFALVVWPVWAAFSVAWIERRHWRILALIGAFGAWIGLSLFVPIQTNPERYLVVTTRHHSIFYDFSTAPILRIVPEMPMRALYLATILVPFLLSNDRRVRWFGIAVVLSAIICQVVFWYAFASVWCFFAAILSLYLAHVFHGLPVSPHAKDTTSQGRPLTSPASAGRGG